MEMVYIEEQGLRDGLQTIPKLVPTELKLNWIDRLIDAGMPSIQLASFVHPRLFPQMADAEILVKETKNKDGQFSGLVLNLKGVERAIACGIKHLSISYSASDTHSRKNTGMGKGEAKISIRESILLAHQEGIAVRAGVQCAFGCRYEGRIDPGVVYEDVAFLLELPIESIALADSTGMGNPNSITEICTNTMDMVGNKALYLHLHNTENKGYANVYAALEAGVRHFDTAFGGLGGCPFIKNATGNIATEDTVHMLHQMGMNTGIDVYLIAALSRDIERYIERPLPGLYTHIALNENIKKI